MHYTAIYDILLVSCKQAGQQGRLNQMPILTASEAQYGRNDSQDQTIAPKYLKILADCEARRIARAAKSAETEKAAQTINTTGGN